MSIIDIKIKRKRIDYTIPEIANAFDELMGIKNFKLPLESEYIEAILDNVDVSVFNALRRTLRDEMIGNCLTFDHADFVFDTLTDLFMADEDFIRGRIRNIKLIPHLSKEMIKTLRFSLNVHNTTDEVKTVYTKDLIVTGGKLTHAIFNPTHELAFIQPGKTLHIKNIYIESGKGINDAVFNNTCRNAGKPLDIEEHPDEEIRGENGKYRVASGFKQSTLISNPKKFRLNFYVPATLDNNGKTSLMVMIDACNNITSRLQYIQRNIEEYQVDNQSTDVITFISTEVVIGGTPMQKYVISVKNETDTIGNLLARTIVDMVPDISECVYSCIDHEKTMRLTVRKIVSDPVELEHLVIKATKHNISIFTALKKDIQKRIK